MPPAALSKLLSSFNAIAASTVPDHVRKSFAVIFFDKAHAECEHTR
jgi:hypothetical protein